MHVMASCRSIGGVLAVLSLVALSHAGPLGPLPNVTSSTDAGLKEGSCVLGDVVYMPGDTFTGATPCERCACAAGSVQCAQERCEPRPGCKALHRPDHCCPSYQCECEQEGRVYGNGEKLVDPEDPCRVCYCQGGEVVCRRIACFVRDDCQPRVVPGRCCPEYDNCPLRGITAIPGLLPPVTSVSTTESINTSPAPAPPKENIKQEITIKEITPVSEIPVITDVKIKEILPSPSIQVPEYPSSKSPLIPREAIPDKTITTSAETSKTEKSVVIELISPLPTHKSSKSAEKNVETDGKADMLPSKISLSTQDSINSEIYPSHIPTIIATMGVPPLTPDSIPVASTSRVAIIEEEDTLFDHNPAFPPIPDDLSNVPTHEDEILFEQNVDNDQITNLHGEQHVPSTLPPATSEPTTTTTTAKAIVETTRATPTTTTIEKQVRKATSTTTTRAPEIETSTLYTLTSTTMQSGAQKGSPFRSALPNEILKIPSSMPEDISGEVDDPEEFATAFEETMTSTTSVSVTKVNDVTTPQILSKDTIFPSTSQVTNTATNKGTQTAPTVTSTTTESGTKAVDETTVVTQTTVTKERDMPRSNEVTRTSSDTTTETTQKITPTTTESKLADETTVIPPILSKSTDKSSEVTPTPFDTTTQTTQTVTSTTTDSTLKLLYKTTVGPSYSSKSNARPSSNEVTSTPFHTTTQTTQRLTESPETLTTKLPEELTSVTASKSNTATEITAQTEFSSLPIETSDQNPHDSSESLPKEKTSFTTRTPLIVEITTFKPTTDFVEPAVTRTPIVQSTTESQSFENVETTEFILNSFGSSERTTDSAELINIFPTQKVKSAAIVDSSQVKDNDGIWGLHDLVREVASISHTDAPKAFSDSEELMLVNAGYKSKNKNFNLNSITEIPLKTKNLQLPSNKQKVVEIEGEDTDSIADAPPPNDKVEPTTRRPIIDNVSDSVPKNETEKTDIEIISQSYVPTINRRPTKVVMKKNNDKLLPDVSTEGSTSASTSSDVATTTDDGTISPFVTNGLLAGELATTADPIVGTDPTTTIAPAQ